MGKTDVLGLRRKRRVGSNSDVARTRSETLRWVRCGLQSAGGSLHAVRAAHSFAPAMMMSKTGSLIS